MRKKIIKQAKAELESFKELVDIYGVDFNKSTKKVIKLQGIWATLSKIKSIFL